MKYKITPFLTLRTLFICFCSALSYFCRAAETSVSSAKTVDGTWNAPDSNVVVDVRAVTLPSLWEKKVPFKVAVFLFEQGDSSRGLKFLTQTDDGIFKFPIDAKQRIFLAGPQKTSGVIQIWTSPGKSCELYNLNLKLSDHKFITRASKLECELKLVGNSIDLLFKNSGKGEINLWEPDTSPSDYYGKSFLLKFRGKEGWISLFRAPTKTGRLGSLRGKTVVLQPEGNQRVILDFDSDKTWNFDEDIRALLRDEQLEYIAFMHTIDGYDGWLRPSEAAAKHFFIYKNPAKVSRPGP